MNKIDCRENIVIIRVEESKLRSLIWQIILYIGRLVTF